MATKKGSKSSKTAHVLNVLAGTKPDTAGEESAEQDLPDEAGAPAPEQKVSEVRQPLRAPILETARANDEALSDEIQQMLEEDWEGESGMPTEIEEMSEESAQAPAPVEAAAPVAPPAAAVEAPAPVAPPAPAVEVPAPVAPPAPAVEAVAPVAPPAAAVEAPAPVAPPVAAVEAPAPVASPVAAVEAAAPIAEEPAQVKDVIVAQLIPSILDIPTGELPPPPAEAEFCHVNVMQALVDEKTMRYIKMFGLCSCSRCIADVKALALTNLMPKYIVMRKGEVIPMLTVYEGRYNTAMTAQIINACKAVMDEPRH